MRDWWVIWTYPGNHSDRPTKVVAATAAKAAEIFINGFSEDFLKKGNVFVFPVPPTYSYEKGVTNTVYNGSSISS